MRINVNLEERKKAFNALRMEKKEDGLIEWIDAVEAIKKRWIAYNTFKAIERRWYMYKVSFDRMVKKNVNMSKLIAEQ